MRFSSCERENKWLDEAPYVIDSSIVPRGGAKRRKSMEPRALSNINGTLKHDSVHGERFGLEKYLYAALPKRGVTKDENNAACQLLVEDAQELMD